MAGDEIAAQMRREAGALLRELDDEQRKLASLEFGDAARRWIEYRPHLRPGGCLALMSVAGRKAAHRLLATGLSEHCFAQAMAIVALEEVLDLQEQRAMNRHGGGYFLTVFGDPAGDDVWSWRFEGHHLSVTMTIAGDEVSPAPVFLGANPACVSYGGRPVSRPLGPRRTSATPCSIRSGRQVASTPSLLIMLPVTSGQPPRLAPGNSTRWVFLRRRSGRRRGRCSGRSSLSIWTGCRRRWPPG